MKNWFVSLENKQRTNVIIISWFVTILSFFLSVVAEFFAFVFVVGLVISILLTKWRSIKNSDSDAYNNGAVISEKAPGFKSVTVAVQDDAEKERKRKKKKTGRVSPTEIKRSARRVGEFTAPLNQYFRRTKKA